MRQTTAICDVCSNATRHEPPRKYWTDERDWVAVTLTGVNGHSYTLDVCPRCQYIVRRAGRYIGLVAKINKCCS